jgi:hypothetical protein
MPFGYPVIVQVTVPPMIAEVVFMPWDYDSPAGRAELDSIHGRVSSMNVFVSASHHQRVDANHILYAQSLFSMPR